MKTIIAMAALLATTWANAQEISRPAKEGTLRLIPAVKTTVTVEGEQYSIARDENNKIVFVKIESNQKFVSPILIQVEEPKNNQK